MQGYEVKFNVYANSQEEADRMTEAAKGFITEMAQKGVAVTAEKLSHAISKWKDSYFVINYFR